MNGLDLSTGLPEVMQSQNWSSVTWSCNGLIVDSQKVPSNVLSTGMGDLHVQHGSVGKSLPVPIMIAMRLPCGCPLQLPEVDANERLKVTARWGHSVQPSHSAICWSELISTSSTSPQFSRWFGAAKSSSLHSAAYSRNSLIMAPMTAS